MTTDMKKFLFDNNDFDAPPVPQAPPPPTYTHEQFLQAQEQNYAKGKADGIAQTRAAQEEEIKNQLQDIARKLEKLVQAEDARALEHMISAVRLSLRIARKLLPAFAERYALPEIERVVLDAVEPRADEPRLSVNVAGAHAEDLRARLSALAAARGYEGKITLQADDALGVTDCRIEWADGGAERVFEDLFASIEAEFEKAVCGMKAAETTQDK